MAFTGEQVRQYITGLPQAELTQSFKNASLGHVYSEFGWGHHYHPDVLLGESDGKTAIPLPRFIAGVYGHSPRHLSFRSRLRITLEDILDEVARPETSEEAINLRVRAARSRMALVASETVAELGHYSGDEPEGPHPPPELNQLVGKAERVIAIPVFARALAEVEENHGRFTDDLSNLERF